MYFAVVEIISYSSIFKNLTMTVEEAGLVPELFVLASDVFLVLKVLKQGYYHTALQAKTYNLLEGHRS